MAQYALIAGRQPEFSYAELLGLAPQLFGGASAQPVLTAHVAFVQADENITSWFPVLGGFQKGGEVLRTFASVTELTQPESIAWLALQLAMNGKIAFGISWYNRSPVRQVGLMIKKELREQGHNSRFVTGDKGELSSVVVEKQLLHKGGELCMVQTPDGIVIVKTQVVQAFEEFSARDYGRPDRDAYSGMLPPKLARMLINMLGMDRSGTLLDPFCGSGTVVQEAALLGYRNIIGSDVSDKAIKESEKNLAWLQKRYPSLPTKHIRFLKADVRELGSTLKPGSVTSVVTEPYLGPSRGSKDLPTLTAELRTLYRRTFEVFHTIVADGGMVVFLLPVFFEGETPVFVPCVDDILDQGFTMRKIFPPQLLPTVQPWLTFRHTLVYHRKGQHVGREVLLLQRQ